MLHVTILFANIRTK